MYKKLLLPTDGSENAERAVAQGIELAGSVGASIVAVYVIDTSSFVSLPETFMWENMRTLLEEEANKALDHVKTLAKKHEVTVKTTIKEGSPAKELLNAADEEKADLIIMGTAGRTGFDRIFLGSISGKVLGSASIPVMIVR